MPLFIDVFLFLSLIYVALRQYSAIWSVVLEVLCFGLLLLWLYVMRFAVICFATSYIEPTKKRIFAWFFSHCFPLWSWIHLPLLEYSKFLKKLRNNQGMVSHRSHRSWRIDMQRSESLTVRESVLELAISIQATGVAAITIWFMSDYVLFCTTSHVTSFLNWAFQQGFPNDLSCVFLFFCHCHISPSPHCLLGFFPFVKMK